MFIIRLLKGYLVFVGGMANFALLAAIIIVVADKLTAHWRWAQLRHTLMPIDTTPVYTLNKHGWSDLPKNRWLKIHQQQITDSIQFTRQSAAGSSFDSKRGSFLLFGSDTHTTDWNNSIYVFDMNSLRWESLYPSNSPESYAISQQGYPVAGKHGDKPWAMMAISAMTYDTAQDNLLVASFSKDLNPPEYVSKILQLQPNIKEHPTWVYSFKEAKWHAFSSHKINFYPYTLAYDSDRQQIVGFQPFGIYVWHPEKSWQKIGERTFDGYETNAIYDSQHHAFILYGSHQLDNTVYVYDAQQQSKSTKAMPTPGKRPPKSHSNPLAFYDAIAKMVALVDAVDGEKHYAQTWLYDLATDSWERVIGADFPYALGMNFTMEYDPQHQVIVLLSSPAYEPTAIWVLKLTH